jgi:hypothetical protein
MKLFQKLALTTAFTTLGLMTWETNPSFAATFTVNNTFDSGAGSLRQAIIDANTAGGNDIIDFLLGSGSQTINLTSEGLSITDNLVINGFGADLITVSSDYYDGGFFSIENGANVGISGLAIDRGRIGIFISSNSTATLTNSTISASRDNGIFNLGKVTLINTNVSGTSEDAINNYGTATLINSSVVGVHESGILNNGTVGLTNSTISRGAFGISNNGTATINNSTVSENVYHGILNNGTATVINSTISNNRVAAIYNFGTTTVTNSTLNRNGIGFLNEGTANIGNTIIAQNSIDFDFFSYMGTINDLGYNLIGNGERSVFVNGVNGNIVGTVANPVNPLLSPLANNGGSTRTQALLPGSLAIDAANPSNFPTIDQRGVSRPQGARADIGAFEVVQTSPPPKSIPEPSATGGLAILGLFGLLRKKVRFSH